ncbi:response regulator [Bdellovibrio sp. HCB2-146]|uniref:response regulator n=1 Tax=Bdellovibrio sp. HCB2-146 TaxID=3394362 RepID=UPI0039BD2846
MGLRRFWRTLSVSNKLYLVIGGMAFLIALELFTLAFAMRTISSVRAIVTGESLWSKAQKDAVLSLHKYARTRDEAWYREFRENMRVPLGDSEGRKALEQVPPDLEGTRRGFLEGKNHPDDIGKLIYLLRNFNQIPQVRAAMDLWNEGDRLNAMLFERAEILHKAIQANDPNTVISRVLMEVDTINEELTIKEREFSFVLGEGSRWLERLLMVGLFLAVLIVECTGLFLTITMSRNLTRGLRELTQAAAQIEQGNFNVKVAIRSEDELGELAQSINKMAVSLKMHTGERVQAENASKVKSLFLANMSHEMRTPLSAIMGFAELLKAPNLTEEERQQYTSIILRTSENLTKIINDILDLSKVEAGYLEVEKSTFSFTTLLHEIHMLVLAKKGDKPIDIQFRLNGRVPDMIHTDPLRLRQILLNILGNAVKFTEKGSIEVSYEIRDSKLMVTIKDTGMGISPEQRRQLFQPFSQVDNSATRRYEGTGLGLVLSRQLARILGGDVELTDSQVGVGCTFVVSVALDNVQNAPAPAHPPLAQKSADTATQLQGMSILIIDDVEDNRLLVHRLLTRRGARVDLAASGIEGIRMAQEKHYDIILMDIQMPLMDGYTATRTLRDAGYDKPIIALTAHAMKEDRDRCLQAGCNDYLTKPIQVDKVISALTKHTQPHYR